MNCSSGVEFIQYLYNHLGTISLSIGAFAGVAHCVFYLVEKREPPTLNATLAKIAGGAALPPAIAMMGAAFNPHSLLGCIENLGLYVLVGSVAVIWLTLQALFPGGIKTPRIWQEWRKRSLRGAERPEQDNI
jgi:hypothetical protein